MWTDSKGRCRKRPTVFQTHVDLSALLLSQCITGVEHKIRK